MNSKDNNLFWEPTEEMVDVSHGLGIPFGGIGTGYSVFGKFGFVQVNFNSTPDAEQTRQYPRGSLWKYDAPASPASDWAFLLSENDRSLLLQERPLVWLPGAVTVDRVRAYAYLPQGHFIFEKPAWQIQLHLAAFSPLIPHDLARSTIPVQVFSLTLRNDSVEKRVFQLKLIHRENLQVAGKTAVWQESDGAVGLACQEGEADGRGAGVSFALAAGEQRTLHFHLAWHYPLFQTPSASSAALYKRYYTAAFPSVSAVLEQAMQDADSWAAAVVGWHDSYKLPPCFKRLWFSALSSVITSTLLSDDPFFFEIESPHSGVNTMDVTVYSCWLYLVNWPELERLDMKQYLMAIPDQGPEAGHVWHSLWDEGADYVEEPIFPGRIYRDYLWLRDRDLLSAAFDKTLLAVRRVYETGHCDSLIVSRHGNQSYDGWKMPGVSAFVNSAWIYSLYALQRMSELLDRDAEISGLPVAELCRLATASFDQMLWNEKEQYWNCFYRTPDAEAGSVPDASFLDQLFGRWLVLLDPASEGLLSKDKIRAALQSLYANNLVDDPAHDFRGWANGMLPGRRPDLTSGIHARTCWIGAQLNLGSLLGDAGEEAQSLDIFRSLEASLHNNHLAVGEWNQAVDADGKSRILAEEPGKDTPRFPPYPRYKSAWEYLVRLLGLKMDYDRLYLDPFKTMDFAIESIELAGALFTISVKKDWKRVTVNGAEAALPLVLDRNAADYRIEFR
ncbi:MAG TPA: hypothetical protein DD640_10485 [Clostridiales bacterium]|nr:hypothetical protein [Clostridiales bacterium]